MILVKQNNPGPVVTQCVRQVAARTFKQFFTIVFMRNQLIDIPDCTQHLIQVCQPLFPVQNFSVHMVFVNGQFKGTFDHLPAGGFHYETIGHALFDSFDCACISISGQIDHWNIEAVCDFFCRFNPVHRPTDMNVHQHQIRFLLI